MPGKTSYQILSVLMLGAISQIGQVLFLREFLMVFHGNELSLGLILAAWLFWTAGGSRLGAFLGESITQTVTWLTLNSAALLLVLPGSIFLIRNLRGFLDILPGAYLSLGDMFLACFLLLAPACLLLGMQFIALAKAWREQDQVRDTSGAVKTYMGEAAGNMLGGILFTFLLVQHLNAFQIALWAGALMLAAALILYTWQARPGLFNLRGSLLSAGVLLLAVLAWPYLQALNQFSLQQKWRHFAPEHNLIAAWQSKYGDISILQRDDQYTFYQSSQLLFSTARAKTSTSVLEAQQAAILAHISLVQHPTPEKILLLGGGLQGTLAEIVKHPVQSIDYLELDQVLLQGARDYVPSSTLQALDDSRVNIQHMDGRLFVKQVKAEYDLVLVDVPDPSTAALNRYYTREFFQEIQDLLTPEGVLVLNATSTADLRDPALVNRNATIYHTLQGVYANVLVAGQDSMFFFASGPKGAISVQPGKLQDRFLQLNIQTEAFSAGHFQVLLQESRTRRLNWILHNHGRSEQAHLQGPKAAPLSLPSIRDQRQEDLPAVNPSYFINQDLKPIGYYYSLMFWERLTRAKGTEVLGWLLRSQFWWAFALAGLALIAGLGLRVVDKRLQKTRSVNFALLCTVFSTGLSTMLLQVALLFSFQSIYGFVYEMVGLIIALFMAGLGLGTAAAYKYVQDKDNINTLAVLQLSMALLAGLIALGLPLAAGLESASLLFALFCALTLLAGLLNGLDFPLATACLQTLHKKPEKSAGLVYGLELIGACLGAVLGTALLAPIHGIVACSILACIGNGAAFMLLLICRRSYV